MAELLGATNRVPGYEGANNNRAQPAPARPNDPQVQNVPDPGRVTRADGRTEQQDAGNALQSDVLRYDSNLQTFLEQLRQSPELAEVLSKAFVQLRGMVSTPGLQEGVAKELAELEDRMNASATPSAAPFRFSEPQIEAYTTIGGVPRLDGSYTVFGEVVEGMDVVRRIEAAPTNDADRPITDIRILKTVLVK